MGSDGSGESLQTQAGVTSSPLATLPYPEICVICLDRVSEKVVALPCGHDQFDFPCLGTWLQQQCVCPLCKREVKATQCGLEESGDFKVFYLPDAELPRRSTHEIERRRQRGRSSSIFGARHGSSPDVLDQQVAALTFRKRVYRDRLFSLRVGTNEISRYRNITHELFQRDERLISRARKWIRRELAVFEFLNPDSASFGCADRRASNAEFLLEYVVSILKSMEIRGSTGQAEELLKDFLGGDNAKLFLHELEAWLRSPFERLDEWDKNVQYAQS